MRAFIDKEVRGNTALQLISGFFIVLTVWWLSMFYRNLQEGFENNAFTLTYPLLALVGGVAGWYFAKQWGGWQSILGKSISWFTLGILSQFLGQALYSYYIYILQVEVPYPSLGDISFFSSVIFYLIGSVYLLRVVGFKSSFRSGLVKLWTILIPLIILALSYWYFLSDYQPDLSDKLVLFLDFGYPILQAFYVSLALIALSISKNLMGGVMRVPITVLIIALVAQYVADFSFSYQVSRESWYVGGTNDYIFALSYFLMTFALFLLGSTFKKFRNSK